MPNESVKDFHIRPMKADEKRAVGAIMRRSFELTQQLFFSWSKDVLVAEQNEKLLGAVVLKVFSLPAGRKGGLIAWVFTSPEARGTGWFGDFALSQPCCYFLCNCLNLRSRDWLPNLSITLSH